MFCAIVRLPIGHVKQATVHPVKDKPSEYLPRRPVQARSKAKVRHMLEVADEMLRDGHLDEFSLPRLATAANLPKATVYQFFPSKFALFNALGESHLAKVESLILRGVDTASPADWESAIRFLIHEVANYYVNEHGARALLLGGSITPQLYAAQESTLQRIADVIRDLLRKEYGVPDLSGQPDIYLLNCEIVRSIFAVGEYTQNAITPEIIEEACRASIGYLRMHFSEH